MMNRLDDSDPPSITCKHKWLSAPTVAYILLLIPLFLVVGCGPLGITDPQSDTLYANSCPNSKPTKTWPVKRTLISNEVNCIAADSENVWIATARGVSRWKRTQDRWLHYTMEDGLANDMVNAVAVDGKWVWFATDEGVSRYDSETDTFSTFGGYRPS